MARSVNEIQQSIINLVQATPELAEASSTSKRAIWRLWTYVVAVTINLYEQLQDVFRAEVESIVALSAPQTPQWVQDRVFKFQYSATDPQVVQLIDLVPQYPNLNPALRIVTRCSVKTSVSGRVNIKVAKSEPPAPLLTAEVDALQSYVTTIGVAGINYVVTSAASDKIAVFANVYYNGSYSAVINQYVVNSIEAYLSSLPFDGALKLTDLEIAIRNTIGVNDCVFNQVTARKDTTAFGSGTNLVYNYQVLSRQWDTVSGYIVGETTSGYTLADTLNFIPQ